VPENIFCLLHRSAVCRPGFKTVSRLEQYAFLLHIALRRLYVHFRVHHELPSGQSIGTKNAQRPADEQYEGNRWRILDYHATTLMSSASNQSLSTANSLPPLVCPSARPWWSRPRVEWQMPMVKSSRHGTLDLICRRRRPRS
jgi:hypothetical protein